MKKCLLLAFACATGVAATQAQVTQISSNKDLQYASPVGTNKALFSSETDNRLYASDGTTAGTISLSTIIVYDGEAFPLNNKVVFKGSSATTGSELFVTDGTPAGTVLLKDIVAGTTGSAIGPEMAMLNGFVYFTAITPAYGCEIWKTDGTTAGTVLLKDIVPGTAGSNLPADYNFFSNGSYLLFNAQTAVSGIELWKSDGTEAGTVLLKDINPGAPSSDATAFSTLGSIVLFQATHASYGKEIWKTDGTAAGTVLVKDIKTGPTNSTSMLSTFFYEFNGRAYFNATDGNNGEELWVTDGSAANTNMVKDIQSGPNGSFNILFNAIKVGNKFIFASSNLFGSRYQLWQSDGTTAGTTLLKDFTAGEEMPIIFSAFEINGTSYTQPLFQGNKFFFMATTPAEGSELWISDGTIAGTQLVKDINPGTASGLSEVTYQYTSDAFYFTANNGVTGNELWKSNGTAGGTTMVADINVGAASSNPLLWPIFNNKLTLSANDGNNAASDLYVLNGNVNPLPIKLGDFTVTAIANDARLQWTTLQEINSKEFIVQRSTDGVVFTNIGTVQAAGQSNTKRSYTFTDAHIISYAHAIVYYRLQAIDIDGKSELTKVVSLKPLGTQWSAKLLNNPVQSSAIISLRGIISHATIKVTDINGKTLYSSSVKGNGNINIPMEGFAKGMYFINIQNDQTTQTIRFVKD